MKILLSLFLLGISFNSFCQHWILTPAGFRDSADSRKKYLMIEAGNLSAKKLYDNALKYIAENKPDSSQRARIKWDSVDIIYDSFVFYLFTSDYLFHYGPVEAYYSTELRFYPGSVRYEILSLDMVEINSGEKLVIKGSPISSMSIYNKHDKLLKPEMKLKIEKYFNGELAILAHFLNQQ
jgi:hypothetical protein